MSSIVIHLDQDISEDSVKIFIDQTAVTGVFKNQCIFIDYPDQFGLHMLKLQTVKPVRFRISQVSIDGCFLRKTVYLSWLTDHKNNFVQPATELWDSGQTWTLPMGFPVSYWIELVEQKIQNNMFGKNLSENFWIYYPESVKLGHGYPTIVQDFFQQNFNFTVVNKDNFDPDQIPYMFYDQPISNDLVQQIRHEVIGKKDYIKTHALSYAQRDENSKEFENWSEQKEWKTLWLYGKHPQADKKTIIDQFPAVKELINTLGLDPWYVFVGFLPPGGFAYPHTDDPNFGHEEYKNYSGCTQLYIPIAWPAGNLIKFAGAGTLDLSDTGAMVVNNDNFTHCVVNTSDQDRYVLGIRCHRSIMDHCQIRPI